MENKRVIQTIKLSLILIVVFVTQYASAQQSKSNSTGVTENIEYDPIENTEIVINVKMIEKFHANSNTIEILDWKSAINQLSFDDAKAYLNAYSKVELKSDGKKLSTTIEQEIVNYKSQLNEDLYRSEQLASTE